MVSDSHQQDVCVCVCVCTRITAPQVHPGYLTHYTIAVSQTQQLHTLSLRTPTCHTQILNQQPYGCGVSALLSVS
jgi:hypothetical protein